MFTGYQIIFYLILIVLVLFLLQKKPDNLILSR